MTHWTHVLSNVSLVEFVLLAALTTFQWVRHRIRGAGWVALSFAILGGLSLVLKIDPGLVANQYVAKSVIALLLVMPYCLFRFAATFRTPSPAVRALAIFVTVAIVAFTFTLKYLPAPGFPAPPHFLAYRISFLVAFGFLCGYVVVSLFLAGRASPRSPPRGCTSWLSRWSGSRFRWWWPHSGCKVPASISPPRR